MVPGAPLFPVGLQVTAGEWTRGQPPPEPHTWKNKSGPVIETWTNGWSIISHLDFVRAPFVSYGVKYIDPVSL